MNTPLILKINRTNWKSITYWLVFFGLTFLFVFTFTSCSDVHVNSERIIELEEDTLRFEAKYDKTHSWSVIGAPHAGIGIPYVKSGMIFKIFMHLDSSTSIPIENNPYDGNQELVYTCLPNITLTKSPNAKHFLYKRTREGKNVCKLVYFLDGKHPFPAMYVTSSVCGDESALDKVPNDLTIANYYINDTNQFYGTDVYDLEDASYWYDYPQFWEAMEKLPKNHSLHYLALSSLDKNPFCCSHVATISANWKDLDQKWKRAVDAKLKRIYSDVSKTRDLEYFLKIQRTLVPVIEESQDNRLQDSYEQFLVENFEIGLSRFLIQKLESSDEPQFSKKYKTKIKQRCASILKNSGDNATELSEVKEVAIALKDSVMKSQCIGKLVKLWPAIPVPCSMIYNGLSEDQKATLIEKSSVIIETDSLNTELLDCSAEIIRTYAECEIQLRLKKKNPTLYLIGYGCDEPVQNVDSTALKMDSSVKE